MEIKKPRASFPSLPSLPMTSLTLVDIVVPKRTLEVGDEHTYPKAGETVEVQCEQFILTAKKTNKTKTAKEFSVQRVQSTATGKLPRTLTLKMGAPNNSSSCDQSIMKMSLGEKALFVVPHGQAYGVQGYPGIIPPNTDVYYIFKLVSIRR